MGMLIRLVLVTVVATGGIRAGIHAERLHAAGLNPWSREGVESISDALAADVTSHIG